MISSEFRNFATMKEWVVCCNREEFNRNSLIFRIMANPIRLEILNRLRVRDHTVGELTALIGLRKANISQHLAILRQFGLIKARRAGQNVFYCLKYSKVVEACKILKEVSEQTQPI